MAVKEFAAGTVLVQSGQPLTALHVITKGSVLASYPGGEFYLHKGDVIGVCGINYDSYILTYRAVEDTALASYPCTGERMTAILSAKSDLVNIITSSLFRQVRDILDHYATTRSDCDNLYQYLQTSYTEYCSFCAAHSITARALPGLENVTGLVLEENVAPWLNGYYTKLQKVVTGLPNKWEDPDFFLGILRNSSHDVHHMLNISLAMHEYKTEISNLLMNKNRLDFFDLYTSILYRIGANDNDSAAITAAISQMITQLEGQASIDRDMFNMRTGEYKAKLAALGSPEEAQSGAAAVVEAADLTDSLNIILAYSECGEETATNFKSCIEKYTKMTDKNNSDDVSRKLRMTMTKLFFKIYEQAFVKSLSDTHVPRIVKMFFNFGYVDEKLAGKENAAYLYSIADSVPSDPSRGVYTVYEWLKEIYEGRKVPSRNEFDNDYPAYVRELKVNGKIAPGDEARLLNDTKEQALFELNNMISSGNKMTFGRISIYAPAFSESNVLKDLPDSLVSADKIHQSFDNLRSIDFGAYYRETMFTKPEIGVGKEGIDIEILPDVILMPNVGVRGVMWQEIEGRKRTSPARMMVSVFQMEDLNSILVRLTGEYRWEMCKRIQGARWNDVSEASLTSEYFDYIQFYKKNKDLSADAKDKIKLSMQKAKNSYKEMYVRDYSAWIIYEGAGSPRLNKVARTILFTHCPFSKEIREKLKANPLYKEMMDRYDIKLSQKLHHMDNLTQKLKNSNIEVPEEIVRQIEYLKK